MTTEYFAPLPPGEELDFDGLLQWLGQQTVSFQKVITGSLQAGQELSSANFVAGSTGWQIDGDGNAEFNDVTIRGDIESGNWDGASPANLATEDGTATVGFYLDSSVGSAQFEGDLFVGGDIDLSGSMSIEGTITMGTGGAFQTSASGNRVVINDSLGFDLIAFYSSNSLNPGEIKAATSGNTRELLILRSPEENANEYGQLAIYSEHDDGSHPYIHVTQGSAADLNSILFNDDHGSSTSAAIGRVNNRKDGIYWTSGGHTIIERNGVVKANFGTDTRLDGINDTTTGAAANVFVNSTTGLMARSTSLRKHKSRITYNVDYLSKIELKPVKFYRKDDKRWWYGFIAEDLAEADTLLGEYGEDGELAGYDLREVVAVLAAKVNNLEKLALANDWR